MSKDIYQLLFACVVQINNTNIRLKFQTSKYFVIILQNYFSKLIIYMANDSLTNIRTKRWGASGQLTQPFNIRLF